MFFFSPLQCRPRPARAPCKTSANKAHRAKSFSWRSSTLQGSTPASRRRSLARKGERHSERRNERQEAPPSHDRQNADVRRRRRDETLRPCLLADWSVAECDGRAIVLTKGESRAPSTQPISLVPRAVLHTHARTPKHTHMHARYLRSASPPGWSVRWRLLSKERKQQEAELGSGK